ncbi:MAG TPA: dihydrodipicolinate synthase family protein [Opitutus sp.]|nr:dihydrodipicolinate synthase family protein [Opitutus sp.]
MQIWSAVPTPLTAHLSVHVPSLHMMIRNAIANGIQGLFLAGTCGEGPWLPDRERNRLVREAVSVGNGRLKIAVQATDNSVLRILENIRQIADAGADYAIIAAPATFMNATPERISAHFIEAADASPLPLGIYDLGLHRPVVMPENRLTEIYLRPNVRLVKDSSGSPSRRAAALAARAQKPGLTLFNGDEFKCLEYLEAGYDGMMFGGAAAVAPQIQQIVEHFCAGRVKEAREVEKGMVKTLFGIYGGEKIACWLTGLKYFMQRRGLFDTTASYLGYPLTAECRAFIDDYVAAAGKVELAAAGGSEHERSDHGSE